MRRQKHKQDTDRAELVGTLKRLILPALLTLALAGAAGAYALARIVESSRPDLALAIMPSLAPALEAKSNQLIVEAGPRRDQGKLIEARQLAVRSLRASPLNPAALRTLAATGPQRIDAWRGMIEMALRLSRRDVEAQLLQIELDVARNDIPSTLRHYDQALRVRPSIGILLFPTLLTATDTPGILPAVLRLIRTDPPWLPRLVTWTLENPDQLPRLARVVHGFPAGSEALAPGYGQALIDALIERRDYAEAVLVHASYSGRTTVPRFGAGFVYRPVDWNVADNYDYGGTLIDRPAPHVRFFAETGSQGVFMSRLVALAPGRYRLSLAAEKPAGDAAGTLSVTVSCQTRELDRMLSAARIPVATGRYFHDFTVPSQSCPFQWLRLSVASSAGSLTADLTRVGVTRIP